MTTPQPFPIQLDNHSIATLTLEPNQGPMVVLDHPLIQRIEASLKALPRQTRGLVLASGSPRVFIAGADLKSIQADSGLNDRELDAYLAYGQRVFAMLCELPYPTAAAINGAALGGGLEIAMHCDALIAAPNSNGKPFPVGLPEAGLAICPGWGGTNLLPARMDAAEAIKRTATGQTMTVDEAIKAGLFDAVAPTPEALLETARSWVKARVDSGGTGKRDGAPLRWISRVADGAINRVSAGFAAIQDDLPDTDSARAVAKAVRAGLESGWQAALEVERKELTRLRSTPAGRTAIQAFFDKARK